MKVINKTHHDTNLISRDKETITRKKRLQTLINRSLRNHRQRASLDFVTDDRDKCNCAKLTIFS